MRPHLPQETQTRDDTVIEVHELGLAQPVDINPRRKAAAEGFGESDSRAALSPTSSRLSHGACAE
jgi:hypothetical protein